MAGVCSSCRALQASRIGLRRSLRLESAWTVQTRTTREFQPSLVAQRAFSFGDRPFTTSKVSKEGRATSRSLRRTYSSKSGRTLASLPDKVEILTGPLGRLSKVLQPRKSAEITTRVGSSFGGNHSLQWTQAPRSVLIVKKQNDDRPLSAMKELIKHIRQAYGGLNVIVEPDAYKELLDAKDEELHAESLIVFDSSSEEERASLAQKTDLVITLGGDGSILHVSSLFNQSAVPPVLSFSMGTLGFLLPYDFGSYQDALRRTLNSEVSLMLRMRLRQTLHDGAGVEICSERGLCKEIHLMNEIALHRGREPHMTMIDAFVDGKHLTRAISDGLIVATPTGSTAYSLSAGGPIVHPSVQSLVVTPICPRSLSFRTVLLPSDTTVQLKVSRASRSPADLSVDGRHFHTLQPGQYLQVSMSPFPIPCVNFSATDERAGSHSSSKDEPALIDGDEAIAVSNGAHAGSISERGDDTWVRDINTLLRFNASFAGRGLLSGSSSDE